MDTLVASCMSPSSCTDGALPELHAAKQNIPSKKTNSFFIIFYPTWLKIQ